ncbi:MAG: DUF1801 domain-containing protein [Emcibacteraceae bacterium]
MTDLKSKIDALLNHSSNWKEERKKLHQIILGCGLDEDVKWGKLCYTYKKSNVAMIYGLKDHCAIGFFKGALIKDKSTILQKPGDNSQAMRWVKFKNIEEISKLEPLLKDYLKEAIDIENSGLKIEFKEKNTLVFPEEFNQKLKEMPELKKAFNALTPGRQRGYNLYFSGAKQAKTRLARIEKCISPILDGKGLNDR